MKELLQIFSTLSLSLPLVMELKDDPHGDSKKNKKTDIYWRIAYAILSASCVVIVDLIAGKDVSWTDPVLYALLSLSFHFLVFDYLIFIPLKINGIIVPTKFNWFNYLGKTAWLDTRPLWISIGPWGRLTVKLFVFIPLVTLYIKHII